MFDNYRVQPNNNYTGAWKTPVWLLFILYYLRLKNFYRDKEHNKLQLRGE